jgi:hypothetical protein
MIINKATNFSITIVDNMNFRIDALSAAQAQADKFAEEYPKQVLAQQQSAQLVIEEAPRSLYRSKPRQHQQPRGQSRESPREQIRERRQAQDYDDYEQQQPQQQQQRQQQQQQLQAQVAPAGKPYRRLSQPPVDPVPQYSGNVPQQIQEILRFQAQIPYDVIANQIIYRPDKPYVPQLAQQPAPQPAQYKPQLPDYQGTAYPQSAPQQPQTQARKAQNPYFDDQQRPVAQPVNEQQY